jgi:hypothetical protein
MNHRMSTAGNHNVRFAVPNEHGCLPTACVLAAQAGQELRLMPGRRLTMPDATQAYSVSVQLLATLSEDKAVFVHCGNLPDWTYCPMHGLG